MKKNIVPSTSGEKNCPQSTAKQTLTHMHYKRQINRAKSHLPDCLEGMRLGWISTNLTRWRISSKEHAEMRAHLLQSHSSRIGLSCQHSLFLSAAFSCSSMSSIYNNVSPEKMLIDSTHKGAEQVRVNTLIAKEKPLHFFSKCVCTAEWSV